MSGATLNGYAVIEARISLWLLGAWTVDAYVDTAENVTGACVLTCEDGMELHGYARTARGGVHLDALHLRIVGGAGGLRTRLDPRDYQGVPLRLPLGELLGAGGEALAATSDQAVLDQLLEHWTVAAHPLGLALSSLLACAGATWRIQPSGEVWVGRETWPSTAFDGQLVDDDHQDASALWHVPSLTLVPGVTILDQDDRPRRISDVEHLIAPDRTQTRTWYADDTTRARGIRGAFDARVRAALPRLDYLARYDGTMQAQSSDGRTVDVRLSDVDRFGDGLSRVPLRLGIPGATAKMNAGARVLVGWDGGDPRRPFAATFPGAEDVTLLRIEGDTIEVIGGPNANVSITTSGTGKVQITAAPIAGAVELGPNPIAAPLVLGSLDSMGVPVTQLPAAVASIVRSG